MEIKDKIYLQEKLKDEYAKICQTEFWKDYLKRLGQERELAVKHCISDPAEDVPKYQGAVRALDTVMGLPIRILEVAPLKFL